MAADADSLVARYGAASGEQTHSAAELLRSEILRSQAPNNIPAALKGVDIRAPALTKKAAFEGQIDALAASLDACQDAGAARWILTLISDMLREDSSCFSLFEEALGKQVNVYQKLLDVVTRQGTEQYVADKAAWLLSSVIGNAPRFFTEAEIRGLVERLQRQGSACSELGVLDALVNLLKADTFRAVLWKMPGVSETITTVSAQNALSPYLYKCIFAMWLLSFEAEGALHLQEDILVKKLRDVLVHSRVEKVIRLSLTVLKNFLDRKAWAEQVVELGVLEAVQQLEYEKWRDSELYEDIRDLACQISARVADMSNFDRYERELKEGQLKWGFIHSSKFWADNVLKFEQSDYKAIKMLAALLHSPDPTTMAVACHDIGEFVAGHPLGKKQIAKFQVKDRVMELMGSTSSELREVRREALLCCQKIMLNKWQDMDNIPQ